MSLSYTSHGEITWMPPHCHDRCPDNAIEERMRGDDAKGRPSGTVGRHWSDAAINFQEATFLEAQSHQNLGEQGGEPSLEPLEAVPPWQHLGFRLLAPRTLKKILFCCFKPPSWWELVKAAMGK